MGVEDFMLALINRPKQFQSISPPVQVIPDSDSDGSEAGDDSGLLDQAVSQGNASLLTDDSGDDLPLLRQKVGSGAGSGEESEDGDEEFDDKVRQR